MTESEMEKTINEIVDKHWEGLDTEGSYSRTTLKLAVLDAYKAGMEAARKVYTS